MTKSEATRACGIDQLCGGLEAGMEGAMHHVRSLWDQNFDEEEDWGILLIDARNAFNEGNRKMMLCVARHEWPSGARFLFNLYRHHSVLIMRGETAKMTITLHSKEGVTQGCPLSMIGYAILILPLIKQLKSEHVNGDSIWCADDGNAIGNLDTINSFLNDYVKLALHLVITLKNLKAS